MHDDPISGSGSPPDTTSDAQAVHPRRIGRFTLVRPVGRGGMGMVYEAMQDEPRRRVALKLMHGTASDEQAIARFKREAELLGRLQHPNIAEVYDAGTHVEGRLKIPYYALAFVDSARSVTAYAAEKRLSRPERLKLFLSVCRAVQHAHASGVVHRDLKPSNLLVDGEGVVRVIDMGISKPLAELGENLTAGEETLGTLRYMPLEALTREDGGDGRPAAPPNYVLADVYALGVILYQLLLDASPYDGDADGRKMTVDARLRAKLRRPRSIDGQFPADLEAVLMKALHAEPAQRYQSAGDLAADLESWLDGRPVRARGDSVIYRTRKRVRRTLNRHPIVVAIVVCAICFGSASHLWPVLHDVGWYRAYASWLTAWPRRAPDAPLEHVVLLAIDDEAAQAAKENGITPFDPSTKPGHRSLYGAVLDRLSEAGARVVLVDLVFERPTKFDAGLILGAGRARDRGTNLVWAINDWSGSSRPKLLEPLRELGTWGSPFLHVATRAPLGIKVLRVGPTGDAEPGVTLRALAAMSGVPADARYELGDDGHVRALPRQGANAIRLSAVSALSIPSANAVNDVVSLDDRMYVQWVEMRSRRSLEASTVPIRRAMSMPLAELHARVRGKIVVLGDVRRDGDVRMTSPDGTEVRGMELIACGLEATASGKEIIRPWWQAEISGLVLSLEALLWLGACVLGTVTAYFTRTISRLLFVLCLTNLLFVAVVLACFRMTGTIIEPVLPICVQAVAGVTVAIVKPKRI